MAASILDVTKKLRTPLKGVNEDAVEKLLAELKGIKDACVVYKMVRPYLKKAVAILKVVCIVDPRACVVAKAIEEFIKTADKLCAV